jgi:hypothetical protein
MKAVSYLTVRSSSHSRIKCVTAQVFTPWSNKMFHEKHHVSATTTFTVLNRIRVPITVYLENRTSTNVYGGM